jgi:hypothetical protein
MHLPKRKRIPFQKKNRRIAEFFKDFDREKRDADYRARLAAGRPRAERSS